MIIRGITTTIGAVLAGCSALVWTSIGWGSEWMPLLAQAAAPAQPNRIAATRSYYWETFVVVMVSLIALYTVCRASRRQ